MYVGDAIAFGRREVEKQLRVLTSYDNLGGAHVPQTWREAVSQNGCQSDRGAGSLCSISCECFSGLCKGGHGDVGAFLGHC